MPERHRRHGSSSPRHLDQYRPARGHAVPTTSRGGGALPRALYRIIDCRRGPLYQAPRLLLWLGSGWRCAGRSVSRFVGGFTSVAAPCSMRASISRLLRLNGWGATIAEFPHPRRVAVGSRAGSIAKVRYRSSSRRCQPAQSGDTCPPPAWHVNGGGAPIAVVQNRVVAARV